MSRFLQFTRGGQVSLHSIHMFWQVMVRFFRIGLWIFLFLSVLIWIRKMNTAEFYALSRYTLAHFCQGNVLCSKTLAFQEPHGKLRHYTPMQMLSIPTVHHAPHRARDKAFSALRWSGGISITVAFLVAIYLVRYGSHQSQNQLLRGARLVTPREFKRIVKKTKLASSWMLGDVPLPLEADTQHMLFCGSPGGGKTVATHEMLAQVREKGQRAIVYDIKGCFVPTYYRPDKDVILNPLDSRSPSWNLWHESQSQMDYEALAAAIVPELTVSGESFWTKAAKTLLAVSAAQFKKRTNPRMKDFLIHLFASDLKSIEELLEGTLGQAMVGKDLERGTRSVILTLVTYCTSLLYLRDEPETPAFSIREWVKNDTQDSWLFISSSETMSEVLKPIISLWLEISVNTLLSLTENRERRLWFFFDELASLQRLPSLKALLSRGRGYGACFVGAIQDIHQLRDLYGVEMAEVLISLFGTSLFFSTNNHRSANWAAEELGKTEFLEAREGYSMGAHEMRDGVTLGQNRKVELLVLDSEIKLLNKREAFMRTSGNWPVTKLKFNYQEPAVLNPAFIERDLSHVTHQLVKVEEQIEQLQADISDANATQPPVTVTPEEKMSLF